MAPISDAADGYCTQRCTTDVECGTGAACERGVEAFGRTFDAGIGGGDASGVCMDTCTRASECRDGYLCAQGLAFHELANTDTCVPIPATDHPADGVVGQACKADGDCEGGRCLTTQWESAGGEALPGGYCSGRCLEDAQCGAGAFCGHGLPGPLTGNCQRSCKSDADCARDGYRCRGVACVPAADPLPDGKVGKACKDDADCGDRRGSCAAALPADGIYSTTRERWPAPGGYCTSTCLDSSDCGAGGVCLLQALDDNAASTVCYARCSSQDDCRDGYSCRPRDDARTSFADPNGGGPSPKVCTPDQPDDDAGTRM
jgi:hypothetical protein